MFPHILRFSSSSFRLAKMRWRHVDANYNANLARTERNRCCWWRGDVDGFNGHNICVLEHTRHLGVAIPWCGFGLAGTPCKPFGGDAATADCTLHPAYPFNRHQHGSKSSVGLRGEHEQLLSIRQVHTYIPLRVYVGAVIFRCCGDCTLT